MRPSRQIAVVLFALMLSGNANAQTIATENVGTPIVSIIEEFTEAIEEPTTEMTEATIVVTTSTVVVTQMATSVATTTDVTEEETVTESWDGPILNRVNGTVEGPSGKETYYNLNMSGVISIMRELDYDHEYWVREDGVKMFGPYVMCAANLEIRPKGSIVETSLGTAIVCDTGSFARENPYQLDIAVSW